MFKKLHWPGRRLRLIVCLILLNISPVLSAEPLIFGVLNQRSVIATAEIWNPILTYVGRKSGVQLELRMGRVAEETTAMTVQGEFDFVFTNHLFTPEREKLGFRVIARFDTPGIRGQIVTLETSPYQTLTDLNGKNVVFANSDAFAGYWLPMDALLRKHVQVSSEFAGNQESAMTQLALGSVAAAAVNDRLMAQFARREGVKYRVLWSSDLYMDLPVMAHPRVPAETVTKVQQALVGMASDDEGRKVLQTVSEKMKRETLATFVASSNREYENYSVFYRTTQVEKSAQ